MTRTSQTRSDTQEGDCNGGGNHDKAYARLLVCVALCAVVVILLRLIVQSIRENRSTAATPPAVAPVLEVTASSKEGRKEIVGPAELKREEVRVSGRVVDETGTPVTGATVYAEMRKDPNGSSETTVVPQICPSEPTGPDGCFTLALAQGNVEYTFRAKADGYFPAHVAVLVPAKGVEDVEIVLHRAGSISGRVVDLGRNPMRDVWVGAEDSSGRVFKTKKSTGRDGQYEIAALPEGEYSLGALYDPPGKPRERVGFFVGKEPEDPLAKVTLRPGEARAGVELIIPWMPGPAVSGRVRESNGRPVADAVVSALVGSPCGYAEEKTDGQGRFTIRYLQSSSTGETPNVVMLMAECPGYEWTTVEGVLVPSKDVEIIMMPAQRGRIEGTVRDAISGEPVKGAGVFLSSELGRTRFVNRSTNRSGSFEIENVKTGVVTLAVYKREYGFQIIGGTVVRADQTSIVDLRLDPAGHLRVDIEYVGHMKGLEAPRDFMCWRADGKTLGPTVNRYVVNDLERGESGGPITRQPAGVYELSLAPGAYHAVLCVDIPLKLIPIVEKLVDGEYYPEFWGGVIYQHRVVQLESGLTTTWRAEVGGTGVVRGEASFPDLGRDSATQIRLYLAMGGDVSSLLERPGRTLIYGEELPAFFASHFDVLVMAGITTSWYYLPCLPAGEYDLAVVSAMRDDAYVREELEILSRQRFALRENEEKIINLP